MKRTALILALTAILIPLNVGLRACCRTSLFGLLDAVEYGLMATTFLAAPWVLSKNAPVAVDIATLALPEGPRRALRRIVCVYQRPASGAGIFATGPARSVRHEPRGGVVSRWTGSRSS